MPHAINAIAIATTPMPHARRMLLVAGLAGLAGLPAQVSARAPARNPRLPPECHWILGTWQSDVEQTMANFTFQGQRPPPDTVARVAAMFGKLTHTFTPSQFIVEEVFDGNRSRREWNYRVERFSEESVSLVFPATGMPGLTLFRKGDGYFVRTGSSNFEYFKKAG